MTRFVLLSMVSAGLVFVSPRGALADPSQKTAKRPQHKKPLKRVNPMRALCNRAKPRAVHCWRAGRIALTKGRRMGKPLRLFMRGCDRGLQKPRGRLFKGLSCQAAAQQLERRGVLRPRVVKRYYAKACRLGVKSACRPVVARRDRDGDGVVDRNDLCPDDPEDRDGFEDADGCPDPDNDRDRILDVNDLCPNDPETYNGIKDKDGCPDRGRVVLKSVRIQIMDKVYFSRNSYRVSRKSIPILKAIVSTLKRNPSVRVLQVHGHAAANETRPRMLAAQRAGAVQTYLVRAGIARSRVRARSFGSKRPVDRRATAMARAKNRRVGFKVIKR